MPFKSAIETGVSGIMLSHILFPKLDKKWPASLSPAIAKDLLRDRMGYDGVVMTDDLDMGAIKKHFDIKTAVSNILSAQVDVILICHKGPDIETAFDIVLSKIRDSKEIDSMGRESVERILNLKNRFL
jgi:beta-N-acetylhexosaminidase